VTTTTPRNLAQQNFGAAAAEYATNSYHASGPDLRLLAEVAKLAGTERVLDCGTGAGHTALLLASTAASVTGIDITEEMLGQARALAAQRGLANVTFETADALALPYPDASFDVVSNRQSAHHYADLGRAMDETRRVLRPGGRFLLIDTVAPEDAGLDTFLNCVELLRDASHVRDQRASEWVRMLESRGFTVTIHHRFVIPLDGADWTQRMRTPASKVAMIRELFETATPAQRAAFDIRDEPWGWTIESILLEAVRG
jgi:ubiquinone/menaquinone biosynthesis C-methylase UbiE